MLLESARFSDLSTFLRWRDNRQALAEYVMDQWDVQSFWKNLSSATWASLIHKWVDLSQSVWDLVHVKKTVIPTPEGQGLPGDSLSTRQLAWSEDMMDFQYSSEKVGIWVHRYAVALKTIIDQKVLPKNLTAHVFSALGRWWARQNDEDIFSTLFRDYPTYFAEQDTLSGAAQTDRVDHLFGRWTYNDAVAPEYFYAWSKTDIEPDGWTNGLEPTDTLSATFLKKLQSNASFYIGMDPISMEDNRNFYGLVLEQIDIDNFFDNSWISTAINSAFQGKEWKSPVFSRVLWELYWIRFFQYAQMAFNDAKNKIVWKGASSAHKGLQGSPLNPEAKVLAYYNWGTSSLTWLRVWEGWDIVSPATRMAEASWATANDHYLLLSRGARHFPYYDGQWSTTVWADSYNKFVMTTAIAAYTAQWGILSNLDLCGRFAIGTEDADAAATYFKILYTGPVFVWTLRLGSQNDTVTFIDTVYRVKIVWMAQWNPGADEFSAVIDNAGWAAWLTALKACLWITTNLALITSAYQTLAYQKQRKAHMFNTVRTILFWSSMLYEAQAWGAEMQQETRDYWAIKGTWLNAVIGKKLATNAQGMISSYAVVCFKRPEV